MNSSTGVSVTTRLRADGIDVPICVVSARDEVDDRVAGLQAGDAFLLGAVVLCAIGYAEGGALSRTLGGPTTICWALVLSAPLTA